MIRKREREKDPYLGHLPVAGPASARPVTVQPSCQSSSSPSPRSSCVLDARAPTPATSCFAVAASPTPSRRHEDGLDPPRSSLSLWTPSSSSALPPSRHRTHLRAPLAVAMTTGHPLSRDRAQQLRNRAPHPQAEGNEPEDFASSPTSSSSPPMPGDRLRRFVGFRPSPRPLTLSTASL